LYIVGIDIVFILLMHGIWTAYKEQNLRFLLNIACFVGCVKISL